MRYWKCVRSNRENKFTVGKIYRTFEDGGGLIADNRESGWINPSRMSKVAEFIEIKEEGENKMEDLRELIKPCYVVVRRDGSICGIFETNKGLKLQEVLGTSKCYLGDYNEDLLKGNFEIEDTDIMEVYGLSEYSFEISTEGRPLIWKRTELSPTQLKLEELEKRQREIADEMEKLRKEL